MKLKKWFTIVALLTAVVVNAQKGKIQGKIIEEGTKLPLIGCSVMIEGTTIGGITDFDGNYSITTEPGTYTLISSYISFATQKIETVSVKPNAVTVINIKMKDQAITSETFEITAIRDKNNEAAISTIKQKSVNLLDGISAQAMAKTGDNSAAGALTRVTGVSIQGGKDVYVRGLGDRYSKTILNGITIPGLDPDKNAVQVDIFSTNVIDNIIVYKTFSPDLPGDFTGGMVDIVTKEFPDQRFYEGSISLGYNHSMNLRSDFLTFKGGSADNFALGANDRELGFNKNEKIPSLFTSPTANATIEKFTKLFDKEMSSIKAKSLLNQNISLSFGNEYRREKNTYGLIATLGYKTNYNFYDDVVINRSYKDNNKNSYVLAAYEKDSGSIGTKEIMWNVLLSGSLKRKKSSYSLAALHNQNGIKTASRLFQESGEESNVAGTNLDKTILYYNQRSITNILLHTTHQFKKNLELKIAISPSLALNKEPDLRQTFYTVNTNKVYTMDGGQGGGVNRSYRNLEERNLNSKADLTKSFYLWKGLESKIKLGFNNVYKQRNFDVIAFSFNHIGADINFTGNPNEVFFDENLINSSTVIPKGFYAIGAIDSSSIFSAKTIVTAGYVMNELPIDSSLKIIYGTRIEKASMNYTGQKQAANLPEDYLKNAVILNELDLLPAISVVYTLFKDFNIRVNYSRTLARPSFKEKSLAQIYDPVTQRTFIGNIDLLETKINNFDLRFEKYMGTSEIISISGFYKIFKNPIEIVAYGASTPNDITPRNVEKATVLGIEFELKKNLDFISKRIKNFIVGSNITLTKSSVDMDNAEYMGRLQEARNNEVVKKVREFQGQAPYLINSFIGYENFEKGLDVNLSYNVQGKSLFIVGISRIPDIYNTPFHSLNFKLSKKLGEKKVHNISFTIQNLLASKREQYYESFNSSSIYYTATINRTFVVGYSFSIK